MATPNDVETTTLPGSGWLIAWGVLLIIAGVWWIALDNSLHAR